MTMSENPMQIKDLRDGMRRVYVEGMVIEIGEPRHVNLRTGGEARVADIRFDDASGSVKLNLWDDRIDLAEKGKKYKVENGYTNSFQGEMRLQVGKYGKFVPINGAK